jgi:hypothetical protein
MFGIAVAPGGWQQCLDHVLAGIPKYPWYLDNILLTDSDDKKHLQILYAILSKLAECGPVQSKKNVYL